MIYFSLSGGIALCFSLPWLLKENGFFRNQLSYRFSVFCFLFSSLRSHHQPTAWSLIVHVRYTSRRSFKDEIFTIPLSRNCQKRPTQKEDQIKSGADPEIQKGVAGTAVSKMDTFYFTENSSDIIENITKRGVGVRGCVVGGAWSLLSASTLNPPMQRNITRKPRSHISNAGRLQSEEQRTYLILMHT